MSPSSSILAYDDIREALDRALSAPNGVSVSFLSKGQAIHFQQRVYKFRLLDRKESRKLFPEGDPRHGRSVYDVITIPKIEEVDNKAFVKILKNEAGNLEIVEL